MSDLKPVRTYAELRQLCIRVWRHLTTPEVAGVILLWNRNLPSTHVSIYGDVEPQRNLPALLREMADKIEKDKGRFVV